jgi:hypothetical protein
MSSKAFRCLTVFKSSTKNFNHHTLNFRKNRLESSKVIYVVFAEELLGMERPLAQPLMMQHFQTLREQTNDMKINFLNL